VTTVVYAGPTVAPDEVRAAVPDAVVLPPAARGDLLGIDWRPGDTAVVIDGYFRERRSVGHKEILWLLSAGVDVVGAASMGALRAVELAPYGMRGLGVVYRMYASGEIDGDDEVGVLHGPAEMGYPTRTVALVNLRHAVRTGLVPAPAGERIVTAAKALPFTHRSWSEIGEKLSEDDRVVMGTMARLVDAGEWDVKRHDALAALRDVAAVDRGGAARRPAAIGLSWTGIIRNQLLIQRTRREYAPGRWRSDVDILNAVRLFDDGYPAVHEEALTCLLTELAAANGQTVDGYARARLGLDEDGDLPDALASWLAGSERVDLSPAERRRLVMVRVWPVWQSVDWRPTVLTQLRESSHWPEWTELVAHADDVAEQTRFGLVVPPPAMAGRIFLRHWRRGGSSPQVEMARRGFVSLADLGATVRRFFPYDVQRGRGLTKTGA